MIVGGDMAQAYDTFVAGLRETLYGNAIAVATQQLQILPWTHGELSGVVGSAPWHSTTSSACARWTSCSQALRARERLTSPETR